MNDELNFSEYKYVEFVSGSYTNRNMIIEISQVDQYLAKSPKLPCWTSHFRFKEDFKSYTESQKDKKGNPKPSVANYEGMGYSDYLWFDIDVKSKDDTLEVRKEALSRALTIYKKILIRLMKKYQLKMDYLRCYFSGSKGFHIGIPMEAFQLEPSSDFHQRCKYLAQKIAGDLVFDESLYDRTRLFRLPNTVNDISGLYKIELSANEILECKDIQIIMDMAKTKRDFQTERLDPDEIAGCLTHLMDDYQVVKTRELQPTEQKSKGTGHDYAGILEGKLEGTSRTDNLIKLAGHWFSKGLPLDEAIAIGKGWDKNNNPGLDADPQYESQYPVGKVAGTIEDIYRRNEEKGASEDENVKLELKSEPIELTNLWAMNLPDPPMIIGNGILPLEGYSMLASFTKIGKTTLAMQMCASIMTATQFLGSPIENQVNILYCYSENTDAGISKLTKQQAAGWGAELKIKEYKLHLLESRGMCLERKDGIEFLKKNIDMTKAGLVIIDPVSLAMEKDINYVATVRSLVHILQKINRELKTAWLLIHHYGKPGVVRREPILNMKGSSGWGDYCESFIGIERYSERKSPDYKKLCFSKRHAPVAEDMCVYLNPATRLFELVENPDVMPAVSMERVVDVVREHGQPISYTLLVELVKQRIGLADRQAKSLILAAKEAGKIIKEDGRYGKYILILT